MKLLRYFSCRFLFPFIFLFSTNCLASVSDFIKNFYAGVEGGYSFGNYINLKPTNPAVVCTPTMQCWDNPTQSFNSDLGNSPLYGAKIGYQFNPLVAMDLSYDIRNGFDWSKTFPGNPLGFPDARKRSISSIRDQSLMFNLYITPNLRWSTLDPYANGGIGWSWNRTGTLTSRDLSNGQVCTISGDRTSSFAWNIGVGTNIIVNKHWFFDIGYRYMDLGIVQTGKTATSLPQSALPIPRLKSDIAFTNELYAGVNFLL